MSPRPGWPYKQEFICHRCGNCCRGDGYVDLTEDDVFRAARNLGISESEFLREYCVKRGEDYVLKDQEDPEQSCIFLIQDDKGLYGCRIHKAKPSQCAGFPFQWRPRNAIQFCEGLRALEGLATPAKKKRMD